MAAIKLLWPAFFISQLRDGRSLAGDDFDIIQSRQSAAPLPHFTRDALSAKRTRSPPLLVLHVSDKTPTTRPQLLSHSIATAHQDAQTKFARWRHTIF